MTTVVRMPTPDAAEAPRQPKAPTYRTPAGVAKEWATSGPLVRLPTGIEPLDELCRDGFPVPWRVFVVGAPSAGKTGVGIVIADRLARAAVDCGACVGVLAVDEDADDITIRLAQIAGYSVAEAEARDPEVMARLADSLEGLMLRIYGPEHTIESAAADLAGWAGAEERRAALFIDSIQTVRCDASGDIHSRDPRALIDASVAAVRQVSDRYRMLVVCTSEANRSSYRSAESAADQNDLASGAESRSIEFGAQTLLVLRTPKGHADTIHVRVAKNRRAKRGDFYLRLDYERHALSVVDKPGHGADEPDADAARAGKVRARVESDAADLLRLLAKHPGLGSRELRGIVRAELGWGVPRLDAAVSRLQSGVQGSRLVNRGEGQRRQWFVQAAGGSC